MPRTAISKPRVVTRFIGGSTLFNGSSSVVKITNQPIYNLVNYSVSFWLKAIPTATDKYIIQQGKSDSVVPFWGIGYYDADAQRFRLRAFIRDDSNNAISGAGYLTDINLVHGKWYHVVVTDAGGSFKCYVNGVYQGINTTYTRGTLTLNQTSFGAAWRTTVGSYFGGNLSEVKVFNSALTASQAQELYISGSVSGVTPVASYALDDQPSTYIDSIAGNNGTGTATVLSTDVPMKLRTAASSRINVNAQYIPNPYMDDDAGAGLPAGWWTYKSTDGDTIMTSSIDRTTFVTGSGSHKLTIYDPTSAWKNNWTGIDFHNIIPSYLRAPGTNLRVFIRYKQSAGTYSGIFLSDELSRNFYEKNGVADWTEVTIDITILKRASNPSLTIQCKNTGTTETATLWIDEFRIFHKPRVSV